MERINRFLASFLIAAFCFVITGCPSGTPDDPSDPAPGTEQPGDNPSDPADPTTPNEPDDNTDEPADEPAVTIIEPTPADEIPGEFGFDSDMFTKDIPEVILSETLEATCLVGVGDTFPTTTLNDLGGTPIDLADTIGVENYKYTIIFFWNSSSSSSLQELEDMDQEMQTEFGPEGVMIIGINEKDSAEMVEEKLEDAGADLPVLLDSDGAFFDQVATDKIARTYLLDAEGKILWFDIEYSEATRRTLRHVIESLLGLKPEAESEETEEGSFDEF